ncbi:hypothetical protein BH09BAC3_BH09BAC3_24940 [soil metagenome]
MVVVTTDLNGLAFKLRTNATQIGVKFMFNGWYNGSLSMFRAKHYM